MNFSFITGLQKRGKTQLLVLPIWEGPKEAADLGVLKDAIRPALKDFKGTLGEVATCYVENERILLLGLGKQEKATVEALRKAYAGLVAAARLKQVDTMHLLFPQCKQKESFLRGMAEGVLLANYSFTYKGASEKTPPLLKSIYWIDAPKTQILQRMEVIAAGVHFARDLVNMNADDKVPIKLADIARKLHPKVQVVVFDKKRIEAEKMGLLLAVNRASVHEPAFIQATYRGDAQSQEHIVLVGKGVTYDTGGLSLKPTDGMVSMKCDMAGAATVLSAVRTAAELGLKVNVTAVVPATENCIGSNSYKLGDVYRSYSGKTVEITNTDAEGRLILADALSFAARTLKPTCLIDLATLTGACVVALGDEIAGLFSPDDALAQELSDAAEEVDEPICKMPFHVDYKEAMKSEIADLVNSFASRDAGAIKAALFLHEFVGDIPWAHLDIAGPAYPSKPKHYYPVKGTGFGLRLLISFLEGRSA